MAKMTEAERQREIARIKKQQGREKPRQDNSFTATELTGAKTVMGSLDQAFGHIVKKKKKKE